MAVDPFPPLTDAEADELERRWDENRRTVRRGGRPSARSATNTGPRQPSPRTSRSTRPTRPKPKGSRTSSGRRVGSAKRSTVPRRSYRRAARQLQAPIEQSFASGMRVIGLTLSVVALYLVLTNAGPFAGVLGGLNRGLSWLSDPTRSIPYAPGTTG